MIGLSANSQEALSRALGAQYTLLNVICVVLLIRNPISVTNGLLPLSNIAFRVDVVRFLTCADDRTFRYQEETLLWWYVMWKIGGERVLRTCGGMQLMGACLETDGRETALSPSAAHINFIVPSHGLLRKLQPIGAEFPSTRPSGIFQDVLSAITCSMMAR